MDKIQRKVSPSLLLDNYMQKKVKKETKVRMKERVKENLVNSAISLSYQANFNLPSKSFCLKGSTKTTNPLSKAKAKGMR